MQADEITHDVDEAINRVLIAERDAQAAVEDCREQAMRIRERARLKAKRVAQRAERRLSAVQAIADHGVSRAIAEIGDEMSARQVEDSLSRERLRQLDNLIDALIDEMV